MRIQSLYKGSISFDALLSTIPIMMMLFFLLNISSTISQDAAETMHRQHVFDKLVSVADYTVKAGAVKRAGGMRYPNWLETGLITPAYVEGLRLRTGLSRLYISTLEPDEDYPSCVYRLVVTGDDKRISRLFVCGG